MKNLFKSFVILFLSLCLNIGEATAQTPEKSLFKKNNNPDPAVILSYLHFMQKSIDEHTNWLNTTDTIQGETNKLIFCKSQNHFYYNTGNNKWKKINLQNDSLILHSSVQISHQTNSPLPIHGAQKYYFLPLRKLE